MLKTSHEMACKNTNIFSNSFIKTIILLAQTVENGGEKSLSLNFPNLLYNYTIIFVYILSK